MRWPTVLAIAVLLSGCASTDADPSFRLSGSFTAERTDADMAEFNTIVRPYSDDVAIMESFPEQFAIRGIVGDCEQLRSTLDAKGYIANVGACVAESA